MYVQIYIFELLLRRENICVQTWLTHAEELFYNFIHGNSEAKKPPTVRRAHYLNIFFVRKEMLCSVRNVFSIRTLTSRVAFQTDK